MTLEERYEYLDNYIADKKIAIEIGKTFIEVIEKFDGKILDKRFCKALNEAVTTGYVSTEFSYLQTSFFIKAHTKFQNSCHYFECKPKMCFVPTESGKNRIVATEFKKAIKDNISRLEADIKKTEQNKGCIEEMRKEFEKLTVQLRDFFDKYDASILEVAGCDYSLRPQGSSCFVDYNFAIR